MGTPKKAILVISFGTSYEETRKKTIEAMEQELAEAFPDRFFYRAWTSGFIRRKVRERDGLLIDSPKDALLRIKSDGVQDVLVVPTVLTEGGEYQKIRESILPFCGDFSQIAISRPLLACRADIEELAGVLEEIFHGTDPGELLAFMGHGSETDPLQVYEQLNTCLKSDGYAHFCVGTVEFTPGFEPVLEEILRRSPRKVVLAPLMMVAGDHALNDMAGKDGDSWKSQIEQKGFPTECILKGLGEYRQIRSLYVRHAQLAKEME